MTLLEGGGRRRRRPLLLQDQSSWTETTSARTPDGQLPSGRDEEHVAANAAARFGPEESVGNPVGRVCPEVEPVEAPVDSAPGKGETQRIGPVGALVEKPAHPIAVSTALALGRG